MKTFYQELKEKGYTRRQFLKFCGIMGTMMGLRQSGVAQIVDALDKKPMPHVIWEHFQECTCCSESFIRASHPLVSKILLEMVSVDYDDTLMAASGFVAEEMKHEVMKEHWGKYILCVEGAIPTGSFGYCTCAGRSALDIFREDVEGAAAIIAWGNCASSGCIQAAHPNPTGAKPVHKLVSGKPVVNVQGCPPIADVMAGVLVYYVTFERLPELDNMGRPKMFYGRRIHDTCYRRAFYDAGLFVQSFDDGNAKKGYCLYYMGCKGPNTFNSCGIIKWNDCISYPIQSGHPCIGCAEPGYFDQEPFYQHLPSVNGIGIEATADKIGAAATVAALAGVSVHAVVTNIQKRKLILNEDEPVKEDEVDGN
ncbi:MAG: hydrogenase small subunit [Clostridium sp.]|nr:hydrogenase small subunit [Clostridium sp.]